MPLVEFEGKSAEEAINKAARALNVPPECLSFQIMSTGSKGLFGLGGKKARIVVDTESSGASDDKEPSPLADGGDPDSFPTLSLPSLKDPLWPIPTTLPRVSDDREAGFLPTVQEALAKEANGIMVGLAPASHVFVIPALFQEWSEEGFAAGDFAPLERLTLAKERIFLPRPLTLPLPGEKVQIGADGPYEKLAQDILLNILGHMGFKVEVVVKTLGERAILDIKSAESALLIGRRGVGLDAMELVVNKIFFRQTRDKAYKDRQRLMVDSEEYRARRHLGILQKSLVLANGAAETLKPQGIPQLTATERQLVRLTLEMVEGVALRSQGTGALRNMIIYPRKK
ncbi:MAG: Jag N-terminal domain-containing protein [Deltaproteobacteria bacterium]|jgi:spoIIIJ-associated protein|nr:Jag N-terminal domain-containing protein [Deltaproteobacteria bacterium]